MEGQTNYAFAIHCSGGKQREFSNALLLDSKNKNYPFVIIYLKFFYEKKFIKETKISCP